MDKIVLALPRVLAVQTVSRLVVAPVSLNKSSFFHTSPAVEAGGKWRRATGRSTYGSTYGPIADLPDWSFADGRPAPIYGARKRRLLKQKEYADYIYKSVYAIEKAKQEASAASENQGTDLKLKAKGT